MEKGAIAQRSAVTRSERTANYGETMRTQRSLESLNNSSTRAPATKAPPANQLWEAPQCQSNGPLRAAADDDWRGNVYGGTHECDGGPASSNPLKVRRRIAASWILAADALARRGTTAVPRRHLWPWSSSP